MNLLNKSETFDFDGIKVERIINEDGDTIWFTPDDSYKLLYGGDKWMKLIRLRYVECIDIPIYEKLYIESFENEKN